MDALDNPGNTPVSPDLSPPVAGRHSALLDFAAARLREQAARVHAARLAAQRQRDATRSFFSPGAASQRLRAAPVLAAATHVQHDRAQREAERASLQRQLNAEQVRSTTPKRPESRPHRPPAVPQVFSIPPSQRPPQLQPGMSDYAGLYHYEMSLQRAKADRLGRMPQAEVAVIQRRLVDGLTASYRVSRESVPQRQRDLANHLAGLTDFKEAVQRATLLRLPPADATVIQRLIAEREAEEARDQALQRQAETHEHLRDRLHELDREDQLPVVQRIQARRGQGAPLPEAVRRHLELGLNADLQGVRVHVDGEADALSKSIGATAFTSGQDIYFQSGRYDPFTPAGLELLAHEATHVVQQGQGKVAPGLDPDATLEAQAQATGAALARTFPGQVSAHQRAAPASPATPAALGTTSVAIQRKASAPAKPALPIPRLTYDMLLERMAMDMAYHDALNEEHQHILQHFGYRSARTVFGLYGLELRLFLPTHRAYPHPVIAFRGTQGGDAANIQSRHRFVQGLRDVLADAKPEGIGQQQFYSNHDLIRTNAEHAASKGVSSSSLWATGHSLGGALAQFAQANFPNLIARTVTFSAPAIPKAEALKVEAYNDTHHAKRLAAMYYNAHDIVPKAGEAQVPGTQYRFSRAAPASDAGMNHTTPSLSGAVHGAQQAGAALTRDQAFLVREGSDDAAKPGGDFIDTRHATTFTAASPTSLEHDDEVHNRVDSVEMLHEFYGQLIEIDDKIRHYSAWLNRAKWVLPERADAAIDAYLRLDLRGELTKFRNQPAEVIRKFIGQYLDQHKETIANALRSLEDIHAGIQEKLASRTANAAAFVTLNRTELAQLRQDVERFRPIVQTLARDTADIIHGHKDREYEQAYAYVVQKYIKPERDARRLPRIASQISIDRSIPKYTRDFMIKDLLTIWYSWHPEAEA